LPTKALLEPFPRLQKLFLPLAQCIKKGDLHAFDLALQEGEDEFVKRRIYLTLERGRDIALRNLLRKVFIAGGFDEPKEGETTPVRRTRVPVAEFRAAICMGSGGELMDTDEVECLIANMIYKVWFIALVVHSEAAIHSPPGCVSSEPGANIGIGFDERIHCPRTGHRGVVQEGRLPGHRCLKAGALMSHSILSVRH
jgi:hypothetical protein